ncbi:unnamed protein product [Parajaminaea phylloscopi]
MAEPAATAITADVLVAGAGIAGLITAADLLQAGRSVVLVEASQQPGGRINDVHGGCSKRDDPPALGAWGFTAEHQSLLQLVQELGLAHKPWPKRTVFAARQHFASSAHELRKKAFDVPETHPFAQLDEGNLDGHALMLVGAAMMQSGQDPVAPPPPHLAAIVGAVFGAEAEDWLRCVSHRYAGMRQEPLDFATLSKSPASHATGLHRIVGGFSAMVDALWRRLESFGKERFRPVLSAALVSIDRSDEVSCAGGDCTYSSMLSLTDGSEMTCKTRAVALCLPAQSLREVAQRSESLLSSLLGEPHLASCRSLPAFKAVAFYDEPWWEDQPATREWLGQDKMLVSCDSSLGLLTAYSSSSSSSSSQQQQHSTHALHLSYSHDEVWKTCTSARKDGQVGVEPASNGDYEAVEAELKCLFDPQGTRDLQIPPPTGFSQKWWDASLHYPGLVPGYAPPNGRLDVQEWACTRPLPDHPAIVLAGEAVSANWGWVEGAIQSAHLAARTLVAQTSVQRSG